MTTTEFAKLAEQAKRLLNVRRMQAGAKAAATQRKIDSIFRDNPGLMDWMKENGK